MEPLTLTLASIVPAALVDHYATSSDLQLWANSQMAARVPDVVLTHPGAEVPYLQRWFIIPRNSWHNVYLHRFLRSDDERALHDHPWPNISWLIEGEYLEHTPQGTFHRRPGDIVEREATSSHRIELIDGQPVTSLFLTGPKEREWGFHCERGWVHWQTFLGSYDGSQPGQGCAA